MATPEERRSVNHLIYDFSIDELQQWTDLHVQQVNYKEEYINKKLLNKIYEIFFN